MRKILIHGSGHKADSWNKVLSYMKDNKDILCPELSTILNGKEASYNNLYSSFVEYCKKIERTSRTMRTFSWRHISIKLCY